MASGQDTQLEKIIDEVLKTGDVKALDGICQFDVNEGNQKKCSQQFLAKLDKLISTSLDQKDFKSACLGLTVIYKYGEKLELPGDCQGLSGLIAQGLFRKWFEKCRQLWIQWGPQWNENLFILSEDFFDALMVVQDSCHEGTYKIIDSFLYPVGQLVVDPRIYIRIRKEATGKFNLILDKIPAQLKKNKNILTSQEASDIMIKLAGQILNGGDYDFQTALMEALCRMATPNQRKELADQWFSMEHVATLFKKIRDSEFETDCRKFLNLVNGIQGDRRRVCSYPCLEVYLGNYELLMPEDEALDEFWIDFNLGSRSISFYFSLGDGDTQWNSLCINDNEVQSYIVKEMNKRCVLQLNLSEAVVVGAVEGPSLTFHFSSSLDIMQAARSVYGHSKHKDFVGKTGRSVVKTTVRVMMEENSSQVAPESQVSVAESEKNTASHLLPAPSAPTQIVTPARIRVSEATTFISSSVGASVHGATSLSAVMPPKTSAKGKGKPSLEMVCSSDRTGELSLGELRTTAKSCSNVTTPSSTFACDKTEQRAASKQANKADKSKKNKPMAKAADMVLAGKGEEECLEQGFVPGTQPRTGSNTSSSWNKLSISEMLMMPTQKVTSLPGPEPSLSLSEEQDCQSSTQMPSVPVSCSISQKQLHADLTQHLKQGLRQKNQVPVHQEPAETRRVSKARGSMAQCVFTSSTPKDKKPQRNASAKGKCSGQMSVKADVALSKAPDKASTSKVLQENVPPSVKAEINRALSSKEVRNTEVAGSMVKLISSRYESIVKGGAEKAKQSRSPLLANRAFFNMDSLATAKKGAPGPVNRMKSYSKTVTTSTRQGNDVFAFNIDAPLSIAEKDRTLFTTSAILNSSGILDSTAPFSTIKNGQPVAKEKRPVKEHLFSDTDTDNAMTEVSWLTELSRKPKPKIAKYTRQAPVKPKVVSAQTSYEALVLPSCSKKPVESISRPKKEQPEQLKTEKPAAAPSRLPAARRRPLRAAATVTKSYKEPDTDDSESESQTHVSKSSSTAILENAKKSGEAAHVMKKMTTSKQPSKSYRKRESKESEQSSTYKACFAVLWEENEKTCSEVPEVKKRKDTSSEKCADTHRRVDRSNRSGLKKPSGFKQNVVPEDSKLNKRNVFPVQQQPDVRQSSSLCLPLIENMRSAERSNPTLGTADIPSPVLPLPTSLSAVSSKEPSFFNSVETYCNLSGIQSITFPTLPSLSPSNQPPPGPSLEQISPIQLPQSSPPALSFPLPLLSSTLIEIDDPSMPSPVQSSFPEDRSFFYDFGKESAVSQASLSLSSTKSSVLSHRVKDAPTAALAVETEKSPQSDRELTHAELHMSGPSCKCDMSSSSDFEESLRKKRKKSKIRRQQTGGLKPRRLFKSRSEAKHEVSKVIASSHIVSSSQWEADAGDGDMDMDLDMDMDEELEPNIAANPCNPWQQFSSEIQTAEEEPSNVHFHFMNKTLEVCNKQSLKIVQHHVSSLNMQVTKYRTQRFKEVEEVFLEEIRKLEQDDIVLRRMEKDLNMFWQKQSRALHSYQEQDKRRSEILTRALQSKAESLEYEERIFTSQMYLIKKDMKSAQDRLLSEMQEKEMQNVKRGLKALFFP